MSSHFSVTKRVEFADTDAAGIMHFSNFFRLMESCEHSFMRSLDIPLSLPGLGSGEMDPSECIGWPRVHASCDFKKALAFEEEVEVELEIEEIQTRSIHYEFQFWKQSQGLEPRILAATGKITVLCVCWDENSKEMKAREIPEDIRGKLEAIKTT